MRNEKFIILCSHFFLFCRRKYTSYILMKREGGKKPTPRAKLNAAEKQSACLELFTFLSTLLRSSFNSFEKKEYEV